MATVTAQLSLSLDGFYSGPTDLDAGFHRVTRWVIDTLAWRQRMGFPGGARGVNSDVVAELQEAAGAYVMGRRVFDLGEMPWGDVPPFRAPVFVVTHRVREPLVREGGTTFTFVTDGIERAFERAAAAAGGRDVAIAGGGCPLRQVLRAGLLDQLELHIAPVVLGDGMRLFDAPGGDAIELTPMRVIDTPCVTHVGYRVDGPAALTVDDRGRDQRADVETGPAAFLSPRGAADHGHERRRRMTTQRDVEHLLRTLAPQALGALVRRHAGFDACEDAVQEALLAAVTRWPADRACTPAGSRLARIEPRTAVPMAPPRLRQKFTWLVATPTSSWPTPACTTAIVSGNVTTRPARARDHKAPPSKRRASLFGHPGSSRATAPGT